ncbi:MAG: type II toxin-antitoxin system RelE/ParE family toxin [Bacteroidales bacterium]|jgi:plasmid stabilization system protein ParE
MATKIEWSEKSVSNLNHIYDFIAKDSPTYAKRFVKSLIETTEKQLFKFPLIGRPAPEFQNTPVNFLKEVMYKGYRIIYLHSDSSEKICIIAVINGRQDIIKNVKPDWVL